MWKNSNETKVNVLYPFIVLLISRLCHVCNLFDQMILEISKQWAVFHFLFINFEVWSGGETKRWVLFSMPLYWSHNWVTCLTVVPPAGILLAVTSIGPAFGFMMGSFMLRFYVDIDKMSKGEHIHKMHHTVTLSVSSTVPSESTHTPWLFPTCCWVIAWI
jgi:hypothetical protein